jgi:hypothetical protein
MNSPRPFSQQSESYELVHSNRLSVSMLLLLLHNSYELTLLGWNVELDETDVSEQMKGLTLADEDPMVQELDLDALPAGRISKLWVALVEGALKIRAVPVIIAKGTHSMEETYVRLLTWSSGGNDFFVTW